MNEEPKATEPEVTEPERACALGPTSGCLPEFSFLRSPLWSFMPWINAKALATWRVQG